MKIRKRKRGHSRDPGPRPVNCCNAFPDGDNGLPAHGKPTHRSWPFSKKQSFPGIDGQTIGSIWPKDVASKIGVL